MLYSHIFALFSWFIKVKVQRIDDGVWTSWRTVICWHCVPHGRRNYTQSHHVNCRHIHPLASADTQSDRRSTTTSTTSRIANNIFSTTKKKHRQQAAEQHPIMPMKHVKGNGSSVCMRAGCAPHTRNFWLWKMQMLISNVYVILNGKSICIWQKFLFLSIHTNVIWYGLLLVRANTLAISFSFFLSLLLLKLSWMIYLISLSTKLIFHSNHHRA